MLAIHFLKACVGVIKMNTWFMWEISWPTDQIFTGE